MEAAAARIRELEAQIAEWRTVALSNQAAAQSHQERWAKAEAALEEIMDMGRETQGPCRPIP
jgi:hypothetical protein